MTKEKEKDTDFVSNFFTDSEITLINESQPNFKQTANHHVIDWAKIKGQEDVITILKNLQLGFGEPTEDLKKLCVLVNKQTGEKV